MNIFSEMSTGVAVVSAFMSGVAFLVFGYAALSGIVSAFKEFMKKGSGQMAVRNK